jgi:hypothetical protein
MSVPNNIILYNYASSPFGRRISDYLALRGIDYALCVRLPIPQYGYAPDNLHLVGTTVDDAAPRPGAPTC